MTTALEWGGVRVTPRPLFTPGKDPVPIVQEAEWVPGPIWTGVENLAPTGIRFSFLTLAEASGIPAALTRDLRSIIFIRCVFWGFFVMDKAAGA